MTRAWVGLVFLWMSVAAAEPAVLTVDAKTPEAPRTWAVLGSFTSLGVGALLSPGPHRARSGEVFTSLRDRTLEGRYGEAWQFWDTGLWAASVQASGSLLTTAMGPFDLGLGPHAGISLGLGRPRWDVFLNASAGAEFFLRQLGPRIPVRAGLGGRVHVGPLTLALLARAGADFEVRRQFALRADALLAVGFER